MITSTSTERTSEQLDAYSDYCISMQGSIAKFIDHLRAIKTPEEQIAYFVLDLLGNTIGVVFSQMFSKEAGSHSTQEDFMTYLTIRFTQTVDRVQEGDYKKVTKN